MKNVIINDLKIDVETFHVLKMLAATYTKGGYMFVADSKLLTALKKEDLCAVSGHNKNAIVGTKKLVDLIPSVEQAICGVQRD